MANAAQSNLFGSEPGGIAGGNSSHFCEVVHGTEFHIAGPRELTHEFE
jgi:hypothetical protein